VPVTSLKKGELVLVVGELQLLEVWTDAFGDP